MLKQAVILCGGKGTRLGPLTQQHPKPLLEVSGKPFLSHLIQEVARYGFTDIILLAGYLGEQIREEYDGQFLGDTGAKITVLIEPTPRGTGGALRFALNQLADEFILMNGDSWIDANLRQFVHQWAQTQDQKADAQILLTHVSDASRYGQVEVTDGRIHTFKEKTPGAEVSGHINSGVYVLKKSLFSQLPDGANISIERDIFPALAARGRLRGVDTAPGAYFIDIGLPETYGRSQDELRENRRRPAVFFDRDGTLNHDEGYTHKPEDLRWIDGAREAIQYANTLGYFVFVVSNQAGIARGLYTQSDVWAFHGAMQSDLAQIGAHIDAIQWCPHHPDGVVEPLNQKCACRKPAPGMIHQLAENWPLDLSRSLMIGDRSWDVEAGLAAGIRSIRYQGGSLLATLMTGLKSTANGHKS